MHLLKMMRSRVESASPPEDGWDKEMIGHAVRAESGEVYALAIWRALTEGTVTYNQQQ